MIFPNNTGSCPVSHRSQVEAIAKAVGLEPREEQSIESLLQAIYGELLRIRSSVRALQSSIQDIQATLNIQH